jgi:predicted RNase H-like nuclease (RuvC/YqgF family)
VTVSDQAHIEAEIAALDREVEALKKQGEKLREQMRRIEDRYQEIWRARHRLVLLRLVGVAGAVKVRFRHLAAKSAHLNDRAGTLLQVKRTRALVDFGDDRPRDLPFEDLIPATAQQDIFAHL